jgi:hypothetical protein
MECWLEVVFIINKLADLERRYVTEEEHKGRQQDARNQGVETRDQLVYRWVGWQADQSCEGALGPHQPEARRVTRPLHRQDLLHQEKRKDRCSRYRPRRKGHGAP